MAGHGDYIDASTLSVAELRAALLKGSDRWAPALALSLLLTKDYPQKAGDLQRVLETGADDRMTAMAAEGLGRLGTPDAVRALTRAASSARPAVRRAAALSLASSGPRDVGHVLRDVSARRAETESDREAAQWSAQLHALRFREPLERPVFRRGLKTVGVDRARAEPVRDHPLTDHDAGTVLEALRRSALRVDVTTRGGRRLRCGRDTYALLLTTDLAEGGPERALAAPAILAVLAHHDDVEAADWEGRYLVVSQPAGEDGADVAVTGPDGRVALVGRARPDGRTLTFELRAVARPGAVAVDCSGQVEAGEVRFDRFASEQRVRRASDAVAPIALAEEDRA